jgi:hypothetical protein
MTKCTELSPDRPSATLELFWADEVNVGTAITENMMFVSFTTTIPVVDSFAVAHSCLFSKRIASCGTAVCVSVKEGFGASYKLLRMQLQRGVLT